MNPSNWSRATRPFREKQLLAIPTRRGCPQCARMADLVDVSANGTALYVCPEWHETSVMSSRRGDASGTESTVTNNQQQ